MDDVERRRRLAEHYRERTTRVAAEFKRMKRSVYQNQTAECYGCGGKAYSTYCPDCLRLVAEVLEGKQ